MEKKELSLLLKQIRKNEHNQVSECSVRIAVLGSCAIQYFVKMLRYYLEQEGIHSKIYEGEYDGINMDVFNEDSSLYQFSPDYIILLPFFTDIRDIPPLLSDRDTVAKFEDSVIEYYKKVWKKLESIPNVRILMSNFVIPPVRILGNIEYQEEYGTNSIIKSINEKLISEKTSSVLIVDLDAIAANIGKYNWFDYSSFFLNKAAVRLDYMPECVMCFVRQLKALRGYTRKCLVLDLDNTLWGGVVGDDGWEGIQLDPNNAVGEAYRFFQSYCHMLRKRGIILAVCSKNDESIAKEAFIKNENMILRLDDISCFVANWENKADNLRKIAHELNIGIDSLVFFDDNPAEREIVKQFLPDVHVVDVPDDPANYVLELEKEQPFDWLQITKEDIERTKTYEDNQKRKQLQESFVNYDEFLSALAMVGKVDTIGPEDIARFTQLINKSNQFNLRTVRYTESDIQKLSNDHNSCCLYAKLLDRYSNYGIISCVILKKEDTTCFIDTWVMSCRVLKRGVENMMYEHVLKKALEMGCSSIKAEYIKTKKNQMVESFYESLGFKLLKAEGSDQKFIKYYYTENFDFKSKHFIKEKLDNE